ncbi:MAG: iron uptake system protein EfeO [Candidatus Nanopelagicales bacterium]
MDLSVRTGVVAVAVPLLVVTVAACQSSTPSQSADTGVVSVASSDESCEVSAADAASGVVRFAVSNTGSQVTEFYVLGEDGLRVMGEAENIAPGLTRDLVVQLPPGSYQLACKPGMTGDGIRSDFAVNDSGVPMPTSDDDSAVIERATANYAAYVRDQSDQLLKDTKEFAAAYQAGDDDTARALYAPTRMHWERIEPVAESFGDLDPILDAREADLEPGQKWTGWHRIEKDLWPPRSGYQPLTQKQRDKLAEQLVTDTTTLADRTQDLTFTADQLGNGAKELLDEVATGKITGEEEAWSHTDLWDFQANLEGAQVMYAGVRPVVADRNPKLAATLDEEFANIQSALDRHRRGDGFVLYPDLTPKQIRELATSVDALGEPLSALTVTVLQGR